MDPITIGALIAAIAGAGLQYKASTDAAQRAEEETQRSLQRQDAFSRQTEKKALDQAQNFNTDNRMANQQAITDQLTQDFTAPVESAQNINASTATTQGDVSNDYSKAKAASDVNVMKNARNLAGLLAKTTGANRLRTNEAIDLADTAAGIDRIGKHANYMGQADQIGIGAAGRPDAGMQLAGGLLSAAGAAGMAYGGTTAAASGGSGVSATANTSASSAAPIYGSTSGGLGMTGAGSTGFKVPSSFLWRAA